MRFFASLDRRRWITAGVTLLLAFLSGFLMQHVLIDREPVAAVGGAPDAARKLRQTEEPKPLPVPPAATLVPILLQPPILPDRVDEARAPGDSRGCEPRLTVEAAPAATLQVHLDAPCHANTRFVLRQRPLSAALSTDGAGRWRARLPAMSSTPVVEVVLGAERLTVGAEVPEAEDYHHAALQWDGPQHLFINAYEFGAEEGTDGHVRPGAPAGPDRALKGEGGYLTSLGDGAGPGFAVYSFPLSGVSASGVVRIAVDAEIAEGTCGRNLGALAFQTGPAGRLSSTELALAMPGCERAGHALRLQNLFRDMRLAAH